MDRSLTRLIKGKVRKKIELKYDHRRSRGGGGGPRGPGPPPIKIPLTTKSYDNIAWRCLVAVFFSVITHITVINNNINDNK